MMRAKIIAMLTALAGLVFAAEIPRKAPEFAVQLLDGKQLKVSDFRGKVLCLVIILTT